eukprot:1331329-Alexandrium_andersonii.AAC.1
MSASLVGSEMCIRDRFMMWSATPCTRSAMSKSGQKRFELKPSKASRPQPVSYTHLTLPTICSV